MPKYLLLKHYRGGPEPHRPFRPMDQWAPADVEAAKALCQGCRARAECLAGALERREPWGVWGGELLLRGTVVPRKRPRGRPRKDDPGLVAKAGEQAA